MTRLALVALVIALFTDCSHSRCAPGETPNDELQACVIPPPCDGGVVNARNECELTQPTLADDGGGPTTGGSGRVAEGDAGTVGGDGAGGSGSGGKAEGGGGGRRGAAGQAGGGQAGGAAPARCGDGTLDPGEKCDGNCKTSCPAPVGCVGTVLKGSASTCDAECVPTTISTIRDGDGCCPMDATNATDKDCPRSCGDGELASDEKCEPGSSDRPCPTAKDCDDGDPCTMDIVTGSAQQCTAQCAHMPIMRTTSQSCDDSDPCTEDMMVESTTTCSYDCTHSMPRTPTGSCVDTDPCTDDTPSMSRTQCAYECQHPPVLPGTDCGNGRMCSDAGRCETPPERCGDGIVTQNEECDPAAPGQVAGYTCNSSCRRLNKLTKCDGPSQCEGSPPSKCDIPGVCRPLCSNEGSLCDILPGATKNESQCISGACAYLCTVYQGVDAEHCGPNLWCDGMYCRVKP